MKEIIKYLIGFVCVLPLAALAGKPTITGTPTIDEPQVLHWTLDHKKSSADLEEQSANRINDLHANFSSCDLVLSTAGNFNMALKELYFEHFLPNNKDIKNWFYTTSPPISVPQAKNKEFTMGNFKSGCAPSIAVGPKKLMEKLQAEGLIQGKPIAVIRNQGNVLLVKKGNPKNIKSIWDLARNDIKVVTSNPKTEAGSFGNYSGSIYNIAKNNPKGAPKNINADKLFNSIFNAGTSGKWLAGGRIHHREVPWSVAMGRADVGPMFYHLALHSKRQFPNRFDIVPLGGTVENPQALTGNKIGTMFIVRLKGNWNDRQKRYRENLISDFVSKPFSKILSKHGLKRPPKFVAGLTNIK